MKESTFRILVVMGLLASIASVGFAGGADEGHTQAKVGSRNLPLLVETEWLAANVGHKDLVIVDFGRKGEDYAAGHIPGAVYLDRTELWTEVNGIPGMFPGVDSAVEALEAAGISSKSTVVVYDTNDGLWASRGFWTLEYLGHKDVHLLNGGLGKWGGEGREISTSAVTPARGEIDVNVRPELLATKQYILDNLGNEKIAVVDARSPGEYNGTDVRSARGGHIPGAVQADWVLNVTDDEVKTFLDKTELSELYASLEVGKDKEAVTLCQTGVRGAHTYFVLRNLGYKNVRLYDGSWADWGNDATTPIEK